jgi:hypothetical protein
MARSAQQWHHRMTAKRFAELRSEDEFGARDLEIVWLPPMPRP